VDKIIELINSSSKLIHLYSFFQGQNRKQLCHITDKTYSTTIISLVATILHKYCVAHET
jgi:hypothetical protein